MHSTYLESWFQFITAPKNMTSDMLDIIELPVQMESRMHFN